MSRQLLFELHITELSLVTATITINSGVRNERTPYGMSSAFEYFSHE